MKLVGYRRVSTDDRDQDPERQTSLLEAAAARDGHEIVAWVSDEGTSAGKRGPPTMDRPSVQEAIRLAHRHGAQGIIVENVDRWTRKGSMDLGYSMFVLERDHGGLQLLFADVPSDPFIREILPPLMAALGRLDNERKASAVRSGMALRKKNGTIQREDGQGAFYGRPRKPPLTEAEWHLVAEVLARGKGMGTAAREVSRARGALDLVDPNQRKERSVTRLWLEVQLAHDPDKSLRLLSWSPPPSRLLLAARQQPGFYQMVETQGEGGANPPGAEGSA